MENIKKMFNLSFSDITVKFIKLTFKSRFLMAKTCNKFPLIAKIVDKLLFEGDNIQVIPRTLKSDNLILENIEINRKISVSQGSMVPYDVLKEIIINSKYHFIMDFCICRTSSNCTDYPHELGCLFLGKGIKRISNRFGRRVNSAEAIEHIYKCYDAGLVHIIGRNKIDSIWLNTGPKEDLLTICHCCPCCCLWKMIPELPEDISKGFTSMIGVKIEFNKDICLGCVKCAADNICFVNAIKIHKRKAIINHNICRKCGKCAEICQENALKILVEPYAIKQSIQQIKKLVNIESE